MIEMQPSQKRELKREQATAAHTLDRHVSVTAGPGSGKTTVLVERYLHILRENKDLSIDQIVAITFTNRAANEMRERLRAGLDAVLRSATGDDRRRWMRYKRTLDGAVITTIHGFCARLLREFPVEAAIDPQFLLLDSHDAAILLEAAVEETLTEFISRERDLISQLAVGFGRGKLSEALVELYRIVRGQGLNLEDLAERTVASHASAELHRDALAQLDQTMNDFLALGRLTPGAESKRSYARSNWATLRTLLAAERPSLAEYCSTIESFRSSGRPKRTGATGAFVEQLDKQLWGEDKQLFGAVPQLCFDLFAKDFAEEVIHVLKEVDRRYRERKHILSALDFEDLQLRALDLLNHSAVLDRATQRYRFFLVDEFQDTNSVQRELMNRLALSSAAAHSNLFIVGDRKQSIYGFRGADVDVFQQMTRALTEVGGIEQPLHLNFRSQPSLIYFFNYLFSRLFQMEESIAPEELSELGYVEFEPSNEQREDQDAGPLVELLIDTKAPAEEDPRAQRTAAERDARQVALRILSLTDPSVDGHREFREIALLFRAMSDVRIYEGILRNANIPFQTVQGKGFYEREEIGDLIQLLRFLDNKTDELALAAVLRSPLGGVSDNALLALRCAPWIKDAENQELPRFFNQPRKLFSAVRRHHEIAFISDEDHTQLDRIAALLVRLIERRNHSPLADLLRFAVEESEYLTVIAANFDGAQRLANVQKLFSLAERFERSGAYLIRDLVRYVEEFESIGSREGEGQIDDSANAVRLMTIHQAKGLEFPVVIVPNLHHRSLRPQEHWFVLDRYRGLTVKVPDGRGKQVAGCTLEKFRVRSRLREHFESIRLLYVAATRAEDRLILSGATEDLTKLNGSADNWLKLIWQKLELQISKSVLVDLDQKVQIDVMLNLADEPIQTIRSDAETESPQIELTGSLTIDFPLIQPIEAEIATGHRFSVTQLINFRRCPRQYYFDRILHVPSADEIAVWNDAEAPEPPANLTATIKGAVIHRFCETFVETDDAETRLRQSFADVINTRRAQLSDRLLDIDAEAAIKELWPLVQNYLASEVFQRVEQARKIATNFREPGNTPGLWSELSFRLRRPLGFITGTIDKLLVLPSNNDNGLEIEIIDFKTNRFVESLPAQPENQQPELATRSKGTSLARVRRKGAKAKQSPNQFAFDFSSPTGNGATRANGALTIDEQVKRAAQDYQLQMQAYALAVRELLPEPSMPGPVKVTLHFLQPDVEVQLPPELLAEESCAKAIDNAMLQIISSTEPEHFPTETEVHCRMCSFLEICKDGREWMKLQREQNSIRR
jgi:ATP-dependent helicase/nuclease subunit A